VSERRLRQTTQFKKDLKRLIKQGKDLTKLGQLVDALAAGQALGAQHRDHPLGGDWAGFRDCHLEPDWVLLYRRHKASS
jgi:mRNA interferase YafQ